MALKPPRDVPHFRGHHIGERGVSFSFDWGWAESPRFSLRSAEALVGELQLLIKQHKDRKKENFDEKFARAIHLTPFKEEKEP